MTDSQALIATSQATNETEDIKSLDVAVNVHDVPLHHILINRHFIDFDSATESPSAPVSVGDTVIQVADTTGFIVGAEIVINDAGGHMREQQFVITAIVVNTSITLDRPVCVAYTTSAVLEVISSFMNVLGSLASPVIYEVAPPNDEIWHIERVLISITDETAMDDAKFGGIPALTNGVVLRSNNTTCHTISYWKSNQDMIEDMYDVTYSSRAPAGSFGLRARFSFNKVDITIKLDGSLGDVMEVLIQDDLTDLSTFRIKAQGHIEDTYPP